MAALRRSMHVLLDESRPLAERFDEAIAGVKGLDRAVATPILLVAYPGKYRVWNTVSTDALTELGVYPTLPKGAGAGREYEAVNAVLLELSSAVGVSPWTLDYLLWKLVKWPA